MNRYRLYTQYVRKEISDEEIANALGITLRDWKFRLTKYGSKMPHVLKTLDRIEEDEITRGQAARVLNVTVRQVNNMMQSWGCTRPIKKYVIERAVAGVKWEIRKKFAIEYIAGSATIEDAAEGAGISVRQMRRWIKDLIWKHYQVTPRELTSLEPRKRARIADELEDAEGLELSKLNVLNEVVRGDVALEEVAISRVLSKRSYKGKPIVHRRPAG